MPIYEYKCTECGHELEAIQKMSDDRLVDCPKCGKPSLQKLISAAGFRLKGGGWYETDFKKTGRKNVAGSESDVKPSSKPDSKPDSAPKSEPKTPAKSGTDKA